MRDPERIKRMLKEIDHIWHQAPDLRLGQLLTNILPEFGENSYYVEDHLLENAMLIWKDEKNE